MFRLVLLFDIFVTLSVNAITIYPNPTIGGWTTNTFAARTMADSKHIPCVLILTQGSSCYYCTQFFKHVFLNPVFQDFISTNGYIGVYNANSSGTWIAVPHQYEQLKWQGGGTTPRFSCYWNKKDGTTVDARNECIAGTRTDPYWYVDYLSNRIGEYSPLPSPTPVPASTQPTTTNSIAKISEYDIISVQHPYSITEGDSIVLRLIRSGSSNSDLTIHILTNGFWCANVFWDKMDYADKIIKVKTNITSEFDDNRTVELTIKSLKGVTISN